MVRKCHSLKIIEVDDTKFMHINAKKNDNMYLATSRRGMKWVFFQGDRAT